jgi:hypothetical protein
MRLVFICGSLEPGRDGVGDYVRRLSGALLKTGHSVTAIAFNDQHVLETLAGNQDAEGTVLGVLRLPSCMPSSDRNRLASVYIEDTDPDTVSLQFVPYSFHKKGLPFLLRKSLERLVKNRRFHILFHELWLDSPVGLKQKITAMVQRRLICRLVASLKPEHIHVSVPFDKSQLEQVHIHSEVLSLFGNICPVRGSVLKGAPVGQASDAYSSLLYFGAPPKGMFKEILFHKLVEFCKSGMQGIRLVLVCGNSVAKDEFCRNLRQMLMGFNCEIADCGFLAAAEVSRLMLQCQAGISKSKPHLLGKSGAAMAMLEHGLPIWMPRWNGTDRLACEFRKQLIFAELHQAIRSEKLSYHPLINEVTAQFKETLRRS